MGAVLSQRATGGDGFAAEIEIGMRVAPRERDLRSLLGAHPRAGFSEPGHQSISRILASLGASTMLLPPREAGLPVSTIRRCSHFRTTVHNPSASSRFLDDSRQQRLASQSCPEALAACDNSRYEFFEW